LGGPEITKSKGRDALRGWTRKSKAGNDLKEMEEGNPSSTGAGTHCLRSDRPNDNRKGSLPPRVAGR